MPFRYFADVTAQVNPGAPTHTDGKIYADHYSTEYRANRSFLLAAQTETVGGIPIGSGYVLPSHLYSSAQVFVGFTGFASGADAKDLLIRSYPRDQMTLRVNSDSIPVGVGGNYGPPPVVVFSPPPPGTAGSRLATGTAVMDRNTVTHISMTSRGAGYLAPPDVSFTRAAGDTYLGNAPTFTLSWGQTEFHDLDTGDRKSYQRIRLPSETDTALADVYTPTYDGSYLVAPTGVTIGPPNLAGGTTATGTLIYAHKTITGLRITNPGSGYTSAPTVAIHRSGKDTATENATFTLAVTTYGYRADYRINFPSTSLFSGNTKKDQAPAGVVNGTVNSTWIWWPAVRYASSYQIVRNTDAVSDDQSIKQLPFEDVGQADTTDYTIAALFNCVPTEVTGGTVVTFTPERPHLDGVVPVVPYNLEYLVAMKLGDTTGQNFGPGVSTEAIPAFTSGQLHRRADLQNKHNTVLDYQAGYQVTAIFPASATAEKIWSVPVWLVDGTPLETVHLVIRATHRSTGARTETLADLDLHVAAVLAEASKVLSPEVELNLSSYKDQDLHLEFQASYDTTNTPMMPALRTADGKVQLRWPIIRGNLGYRLFYYDDNGVKAEQILADPLSNYYRDAPVVLHRAVESFTPWREIQLTWDPLLMATGYEVFRRPAASDENWSLLSTLTDPELPFNSTGKHPTSFLDPEVLVGIDYEYRVVAGRQAAKYEVVSRFPPDALLSHRENIRVNWPVSDWPVEDRYGGSVPVKPRATYQLQRKMVSLNYETAKYVTSEERPGDGNDDGQINGEASVDPAKRESSDWVTLAAASSAAGEYYDAPENRLGYLASLEYRVLVTFDASSYPESAAVVPFDQGPEMRKTWPHPLNHSHGHVITWPELGAERYHVRGWVRYRGDTDADFLENIPGPRRFLVAGGLIPDGRSPKPEATDNLDLSQPTSVLYRILVGPKPVGGQATGSPDPQQKKIQYGARTSVRYPVSWLEAESFSSYTFEHRALLGDLSPSAWAKADVTQTIADPLHFAGSYIVDTPSKPLSYAISYGLRGAMESSRYRIT